MRIITEAQRKLIIYYLENPENITRSKVELPKLIKELKNSKSVTIKPRK